MSIKDYLDKYAGTAFIIFAVVVVAWLYWGSTLMKMDFTCKNNPWEISVETCAKVTELRKPFLEN